LTQNGFLGFFSKLRYIRNPSFDTPGSPILMIML
jgi:hypothetical protein